MTFRKTAKPSTTTMPLKASCGPTHPGPGSEPQCTSQTQRRQEGSDPFSSARDPQIHQQQQHSPAPPRQSGEGLSIIIVMQLPFHYSANAAATAAVCTSATRFYGGVQQGKERLGIQPNPEDQDQDGNQHQQLAPTQISRASVFLMCHRTQEDLFKHGQQINRRQDHTQRGQHRQTTGCRVICEPKAPSRMVNSPTKPFNPGSPAEDRMTNRISAPITGNTFQSRQRPPFDACAGVHTACPRSGTAPRCSDRG